MTDEEKWSIAESTLDKLMIYSDAHENALEGLMIAPESPLVEPVWQMQSMVVNLLEKLVGDEYGAINWYVFENDFGRDAKEAGCEDDMPAIDSVEMLRWLCELECDK